MHTFKNLIQTFIKNKIKNEYQAIQLGKKHNYVSGSNVYFGKYLNEKVIIKGFDIFNLYKNEINILNILNQKLFLHHYGLIFFERFQIIFLNYTKSSSKHCNVHHLYLFLK